jgi:predicted ATPase
MTAKFIVITGGPCSGKTTIIDALAGRGHTTVPEAATELIEDPGLEDLRTNPREFQLQVLLRQLENEQRVLETASADSVVFLDRGVGDGFGYLRYHGIEPFEELDYQPASHRSETPAEARRIQEILLEDYRSRHDRVILIPWLPVEERLAAVLEEAGLEDREA